MSVSLPGAVPASFDGVVARQPLQVVVTAAGRENILFRQLLRDAAPILSDPQAYPPDHREALVEKISTALFLDMNDDPIGESDAPFSNEYEPGCLPDWEGDWP